jgi:tRNA G18 (ribose-2'-O)-methylase SpoU
MDELILILHDIRSAENVGSMFRTADAAGVSRIFLTGYTPAPLDRFKRKNGKIAKAALGAEEYVSWEKREDTLALVEELKARGVRVVAVEQDNSAVPYTTLERSGPLALIMGNEVGGIPEMLLRAADAVVEIPMHGKKESLNVAVAAGIVLFRLNS